MGINFQSLALAGELYTDETTRRLYATDASAYRELPLAVAIPLDNEDIQKLIAFAKENKTSLIPRTAGTSLAGQVVGGGIVVDVSKYFNNIIEVNETEKWVRVQPGVIRDDLNKHLAPYGLYFAPETSTANRAMIGGMIGNNSCGANSVVYGSTRDHLVAAQGFLSDGSFTNFNSLDDNAYLAKVNGSNVSGQLENEIYFNVHEMLSDEANRKEIDKEFPKHSIPRRNTGYAIDLLAKMSPFEGGDDFNFCNLIAGSEGTIFFLTEAKLNLVDIPPKHKALVCLHCESIDESLRANIVALKHEPTAVELMDHYILECTKANIEQVKNRFFVDGDPSAILVVEISKVSEEEVDKTVEHLISDFKAQKMGYHYPVVKGDDIKKVWTLRKAGLGLLSNIPGDAKPAPVIEDTAVDVNDLPAYIAEFNEILKKHNLYSVHYAHAGSGELHLRPIIDLKTKEGNRLFRVIAEEIATLVKKYDGSLSGEHGDGRLRGEFIPQMIGEKNYELVRKIKQTWDPHNIFNPGKIVDTPSMNEGLRYTPGQETPEINTYFDFSDTQGIVRAAELCNGSGDCRKSELSGGTMCPSFMATGNEKDTTRARANILREMITKSEQPNGNYFDHPEIKEVMDLCLSCKGCKSECPSNVDMAKLKAEFTQHYYDKHGAPFRSKQIANVTSGMKIAEKIPGLYNWGVSNKLTSSVFKGIMGFAQDRPIPKVSKQTLRKWYNKEFDNSVEEEKAFKTVYFFADEFTNYQDVEIGKKAVLLLDKLGYFVKLSNLEESGRTWLSKGFVKQAKQLINKNLQALAEEIQNDEPLLGIEPSTILSFRDEYLSLAETENKSLANRYSKSAMMVEDFLELELKEGNLNSDLFTDEKRLIKLHGHCHQKALSSVTPTKKLLSLPKNYEVQMIPSGCCGMAGSFGYEKEHYDVSMQVGELVLFPTVRKQPQEVIIAAPGTSCRHQIKDGTERDALHPVEILYDALRN